MANKSVTEKHRCSVLAILNTQRLEEKLCDVTITVGDKQFHAHRNVLSASSDYFRSMFTSGFQERNEISLELKGFRSSSFERLIEFAYTGAMEVRDIGVEDGVDMLNMAAYLQLRHAVKLLSQALLRAVECGQADFIETYHIWKMAHLLAKGMDIEDLAMVTLDILAKNFIEFAQNEMFMSDVSSEFLERCLEKNILATILPEEEDAKEEDGPQGDGGATGNGAGATGVGATGDGVGAKDGAVNETACAHQDLGLSEERTKREHKILEIILSWLHHDWNQRKTYAYDLISKLRLGFISKTNLQALASTDLSDLPECVKLIDSIIPTDTLQQNGNHEENKMFKPRGVVMVPILIASQKSENKVKIFNATTGTWLDIASFDETPFDGLSKFNCLAVDNQLYVCGGIGDSDAKKSFCRYDINDKPSQMILSDMHNPRSDCVLVHLDNFIYAISGIEARIDQADFETLTVERYNLNEVRFDSPIFEERVNPWELVESLPAACWSLHGVVYKGKILVCGLQSKAPIVNHLNHPYMNPPSIPYLLFIYDPVTKIWQRNLLQERPIVMPMQGKQNYVMLLVHQGECYLIGTTEVPSFRNPNMPWFRITVNKLNFEEGAPLRFVDIGGSINQDLLTNEYFSSFFYIGDDVYHTWRRNIVKVRQGFKEVMNSYDGFPTKDSQSMGNALLDINWLG